jgi:hypothetical protein
MCTCGLAAAVVARTLPAAGQQFVEETAARFPLPNPTEFTNQLTIGDLDNDGDLDIIFANGGDFNEAGIPQRQRVYMNNGSSTFADETIRLNFAGLCRGVELGDIDNDGDLDVIFVQDFNRLPGLFVNDGSGVFTDVSAAQLPPITLSSSRAQFGDTEQLPDTEDTAGPYVVRASILDGMTSDRNFFDGGISLSYTVNAGPDVQVPMRHSGGQVYRGEIPGQAPGSAVTYFVTAADRVGNEGVGAPRAFQVGGVFGDLDGDCSVGVTDFLLLLASWT